MTEITIDKQFIFFMAGVFIWIFFFGAYMQCYYDIGHIKVNTDWLVYILCFTLGVCVVKLYDGVFGD